MLCGQVLDGAAYHTHLDNVQRLRKGTLQVGLEYQYLSVYEQAWLAQCACLLHVLWLP